YLPVASSTAMECSSPPTPWLASHSSRRGGYASSSYPSSSNPVNRNKTAATNACIEPSKPKQPDPRLTPAALNSANSIASAMSLTSSARTRHSISKPRLLSMQPLHVQCLRKFRPLSTPIVSKCVTSAPMAVYDGTSNG